MLFDMSLAKLAGDAAEVAGHDESVDGGDNEGNQNDDSDDSD
jgi:hypothetical protein